MHRRSWVGLAVLNLALATPWSLVHAESAVNIPAPAGCFWRAAPEPHQDRPRLRCQQADGTWTYWNDPYLDEHTVANAQAGDPRAMTVLGIFYHVSAPKNLLDPHIAMNWYQTAAAKGYGAAMTQIGLLYAEGLGVPKNDGEATRWFLAGATAGDSKAMFIVGVMYDHGDGLPKDETLARHWHLEAAERGEPVSMMVLSKMYRDGVGGAKDSVKADLWSDRYDKTICAEMGAANAAFGVKEPVACETKQHDAPAPDFAKVDPEVTRLAADAARAAADATQTAADEAKVVPKCATTREGC